MTHRQMAMYIATKSAGRKIVAFVLGGKLRTFDYDHDRTELMLLDYPESCLGVYVDADAEAVYEDVASLLNVKPS